jgi:hypothetical protein
MRDTASPAPETASVSYQVFRGVLSRGEVEALHGHVRKTIHEQVDADYYGVSAPLLSEFAGRFDAVVSRLAELLRASYGFRYQLCNAMFYETSFYTDTYIAAHVDKVNDFAVDSEFDMQRSIQIWFPVAQTEPNSMHLAPRERNEFYRELDDSPEPYEIFAADGRVFFRSRYTSKILFEWTEPIRFDTPRLEPGDVLAFSQRTLHFTEKIGKVGGYRVAVALRYIDRELAIRPFKAGLARMLAINDHEFQRTAAGAEPARSSYLGVVERDEK